MNNDLAVLPSHNNFALLRQYQKWILFLPSLLRWALIAEASGINIF